MARPLFTVLVHIYDSHTTLFFLRPLSVRTIPNRFIPLFRGRGATLSCIRYLSHDGINALTADDFSIAGRLLTGHQVQCSRRLFASIRCSWRLPT